MNCRKTALLCGTTLALALGSGLAAQAQTPAPSTTNTAAATTTDANEVEAIVVTGTRIKKSEFTTASPVQVITTEQTDLRGIPDAATALLTSTTAASSFQINDQLTGYVTQGGGGTQSIALRGLGTQRTLTLINGKRAGPAGTRGQVQAFDLNNIPAAQIERYDILKDGASSLYGSDAIAGVVNVITKRNLNGGAVNAFASIPTQHGGKQYRLDATFGQTFDKWYYNASVNYQENKVLRNQDRAETRCAADFVFDPTTFERLDVRDPATGKYKCFNLTSDYVTVSFPTALGGTMNLTRYNPITMPNGAPTAAQGNNTPTGPEWVRFARANFPLTYGIQPSNNRFYDASSVISPSINEGVTFTSGYFISDRAEMYTELLYNRRESNQYGAAQIFPSFAQRNSVNGAANTLPGSNPNNPFGYNTTFVSTYESSSAQSIDYYRGVVGLRGDVGVFGIDWDYDVYGQYSLSDGMYDNGPRAYLDRFLALSSPGVACTNNPAGGNFSGFDCASLPNGIPWTSERVLTGNFTPAEKAFLFIDEQHFTTYHHAYVEGVVSTDKLFSLPAGDVGAAFGFQVRHESINDRPGYQARNRNIALYTSAGITRGSDDVREAFGELELPILKDVFLAKEVNLNISGRFSDYDSYGSTATYKAGLNWSLTDEYRFRASIGNSFRAPALYELFLGSQVGYSAQSSVDPCYNYGASSTISPTVVAACVALGIPSNQTGGSSATIRSIGGAGYLEAETADTYNIGAVWTPSYLPLSVAVDYFYTEIQNEVAQFGAFNIINQCLMGLTEFCPLYQRDPVSHYVTTVDNSYVNITKQKTSGIDLQLRWSNPVPWGRLTIESEHSWKLVDKAIRLGGLPTDYLGDTFNYNGPQYAGNVYVNFDHGPFTLFYGIDMIGHASDTVEFGGDVFGSNRYASVTVPVFYIEENKFWATQSVSLRYRNEGYTLQAGVNNFTDKGPPQVSTGEFRRGTAMLNGYDMRGRRVFFRIGKTF